MTANLTPCRPGQRPVRAASARRVDARPAHWPACGPECAGASSPWSPPVSWSRVHATASAAGVAAAFSFRAAASRSRFSWPRAGRGRLRELPRHAGERVLESLGLDRGARLASRARAAPTRVLRDLSARPAPIQLRVLGARPCEHDRAARSAGPRRDRRGRTLRVAQQRLLGLGEHGPYGVVHGVPGWRTKRICSVLASIAAAKAMIRRMHAPMTPQRCFIVGVVVLAALQRRTRARRVRIAFGDAFAIGLTARVPAPRTECRALDGPTSDSTVTTLVAALRYGGVAFVLVTVVLVIVAVIPATSDFLEDSRADVSGPRLVFEIAVPILLLTVIPEEFAFRGVLAGSRSRIWSDRGAALATSMLFGLWHISPTLDTMSQNHQLDDATNSTGGTILLVCRHRPGDVRRRARVLLAPAPLAQPRRADHRPPVDQRRRTRGRLDRRALTRACRTTARTRGSAGRDLGDLPVDDGEVQPRSR